jgi:transglutaminase-like putative cysteine protease
MMAVLRRVSLQTMVQLSLLLVAFSAFVTGLGAVVRGAETSAFLPAAIPAVLLGWGLARTRSKAVPALTGLMLLGGLFLWARAAQSGAAAWALASSLGVYLWGKFIYVHGGPLLVDPGALAAVAQTAIQSLSAQSYAVWVRMAGWLAGLRAGTNVNDPAVRVLVWSLALWVLAAWAGWAVKRNKVLAGMVPGLAVLALIIKYTDADVTSLWLMTVSMLGLMSLSHFDANVRRWVASRLDYAELIASNTTMAAVFITLALAMLGWTLPMISIKDMLESFRRHDAPVNQAARSLGLEAARDPVKPVQSGFTAIRAPELPNNHLLGSGPELSRDVVFTVQTGELAPIPASANVPISAPRHYWRSYTFDIYSGAGWVSSHVESRKTSAGQALFEIPPGYKLLKQDFVMKHGDEGSLYWSGSLYRSDTPFEAAWRTPPGQAYPMVVDPFRGADLYGALNSAPIFRVESLVPQVSAAQLRAAGRDIPDFIQQRYTQLPSEVPERVYALARDLTSAAISPYDEARAIESYLRANYPYTLDVPLPPQGVDVADYFLFDLKKGYCDYYATAMVVMARSVGLPARLVMGYASGTYNAASAEYIVTAADAHAWVEIYFSGIGWVEFEPTAGQPEILRPGSGGANGQPEPAPLHEWDQLIRSVYRMPPAARWVIFALAGMLGLAVLFFLLEGWLLGLARPAFALRWMYRSIYRQAGPISGRPVPGQTASEFEERLQAVFKQPDSHLAVLTGLYLRVLFSPESLQKAELQQAVRAWRRLRWKLFWFRIITRVSRKRPLRAARKL